MNVEQPQLVSVLNLNVLIVYSSLNYNSKTTKMGAFPSFWPPLYIVKEPAVLAAEVSSGPLLFEGVTCPELEAMIILLLVPQ